MIMKNINANLIKQLKEKINNLKQINNFLDKKLQFYLNALPFLGLFVKEDLKEFNQSNIYNTECTMSNTVKYKILDPRLGSEFELPNYGKNGNAGIDLRAMISKPIQLKRGSYVKVKTGLSVEMPSNMVGIILPRSGTGIKGLTIMNTVGVIDSNYRGELLLSLKYEPFNEQGADEIIPDSYLINVGDRICQILFMPIYTVDLLQVNQLNDSIRNSNGFGSSGLQ